MPNKFKSTLLILAFLGAFAAVNSLFLLSFERRAKLVKSDEARQAAEDFLARFQAIRVTSIDDRALNDSALMASAGPTMRNPYVAAVWLFAPDGRIVCGSGATALSTMGYRTVKNAATDDAQSLLETLPEDMFTDLQRTSILAASAMRREGSHNDIYDHLLRPIKKEDGSIVGLVGIAYLISKSLTEPVGLGWIAGVLVIPIGLGVYWLSLPLWVLLDARQRGERAWPWAIFVFIGNLVAFIAYALAREPRRQTDPSE